MPLTPAQFESRADRLRDQLAEQGVRVRDMIDAAFTAVFDGDHAAARNVVDADDQVDRMDVQIEQDSVALLIESAHEAVTLDDRQIRAVLTVVKVNNEIERLADAAVAIAEGVLAHAAAPDDEALPPTFRVMANSIVGITRDAVDAYANPHPKLARTVLASAATVEAFRQGILRQSEAQLAAGNLSIERAFTLHAISGQCERMADYCTNIAEQVIYVATGTIVRHTDSGWIDVD